jgi:hypothetical protein
VTFEFDYLLDPIGPDQAPGASRFVPADAMTPTPGGSNDQPGGAATGVDADAWLIELLTERAPPAPTTTYEDMTWLDEPVGAAAVPTALPRPVLDTRVDLPPPAALAGLAGLAALIPGTDPRPSDAPVTQDIVGSRFAASRTDDDRLPIRRRGRRRRPRRSH